MEVLHPRCAGIDIGKKTVVVCVRVAGAGRRKASEQVTEYATVTRELLRLREDLLAAQVTCAVMESTGDYWKPVYYLLEDAGIELVVGNARAIRNLPGRKSDVSDSRWLAQLGAHGLVQGSFVPPPGIRELRDLTRDRSAFIQERARLLTRLHNVLEDAGIKLSLVASDLNGVSSRDMLAALVRGERDPHELAALARGRLKAKHLQLVDALTGRFTEHHAFRVQSLLDQIDTLEATAERYTQRIEQVIEPYRWFRDLICTVPGVSTIVADVITAETGADMSVFPTAKHLASWAGISPGSNESAGVVKNTKTRKGNNHLKGALGVAAMSIARSKGTRLHARHWRIAARRGKLRALVATEHAILTAIWHMASTQTPYTDLGADYYTRREPERSTRRAVTQLEQLGYTVTLTKETG
jgi:transposase